MLTTKQKQIRIALVSILTILALGVAFVFVYFNQQSDNGVSAAQNLWLSRGQNSFGSMCLNTRSTEITRRNFPGTNNGIFDDVVDFASGEDHTLILRSDGTVWATGKNDRGQLGLGFTSEREFLTQVPGLANVKAVYAGYNSSFAISDEFNQNNVLQEGVLRVWGANEYGQLGKSDEIDRTLPEILFANSILSVASGRDFTLFLRSDFSVQSTGSNAFGQLGDPSISDKRNIPDTANLNNNDIRQIVAGEHFAMALDGNGDVYTWGLNNHGQLGSGLNVNKQTPSIIPGIDNVAYITAGEAHGAAIKSDDTVFEWGSKNATISSIDTNTPSQVTNFPAGSTFTNLTSGIGESTRIGSSRNNTYLTDDDDNLIIWGSNLYGQATNNTRSQKINPTEIDITAGVGLISSIKGDFVVIADNSPDNLLSGWGSNNYYNIGYLSTDIGEDDFSVDTSQLQGFTQISGGKSHTLMVATNGTVIACGENFDGQLGQPGTVANAYIPTAVTGINNIIETAATDFGSYALRNDGVVFEWGDTPNGGNSPTQVSGLSNIVSINASNDNLVAVNATGQLFVYGFSLSQSGTGQVPLTPQSPLSGIEKVVCAYQSCAALETDGDVLVTGNGSFGQFGNGSFNNNNNFTGASISNVVDIFASPDQRGYIAIDNIGDVYGWGSQDLLGNDTVTLPQALPTLIQIDNVKTIGVMYGGVYAQKNDNTLWIWNRNNPFQEKNIQGVDILPQNLSGPKAFVKGELLEPITDFAALNVFCQIALTSNDNLNLNFSTICRFDLPADKRVPDNFQLIIGDGDPSGECYTTSGIVFCENVATGSVSGENDILVTLDGGLTTTFTGETVELGETDSDEDGMPDVWEITNGLDPQVNDAAGDLDNDDLTNINEYILGTDPAQRDTDSDQLSDGVEVKVTLTLPTVNDSDSLFTSNIDESNNTVLDGAEDFDGDTYKNSEEISQGTNPVDPNSKPAEDLVAADIPDMIFYCEAGNSGGFTTCEFNLPIDKLLPTNFGISVNSTNTSTSQCSLNITSRVVTCTQVTIGIGSGLQDILAEIGGGGTIDTGNDAFVDLLDTDGDDLPDEWEDLYAGTNGSGLDKNDDGSGLVKNGADGDPDGDNLTNREEFFYGTNPILDDTDSDNINDGDETGILKTDPNDADSDSAKTATDEGNNGSTDGNEDFDNDGFDNREEIEGNSNPFDSSSTPDTEINSVFIQQMVFFCDEGLINDTTTCRSSIPAGKFLDDQIFMSIGNGADSPPCNVSGSSITCLNVPTGPNSGLQTIFAKLSNNPKINTGTRVRINGVVQTDSDNDGLPDAWEIANGLDPNNAGGANGANGDPDQDGLSNTQEYNNGTNPNQADSDNDGVKDGDEIFILNTNPTEPDSDSLRTPQNEAGNGTFDGAEDFDNDGFNTTDELNAGTDPFTANSTPGTNFDSLDIVNLVVFCQEGLINQTTTCNFNLPSGKFLPVNFKLGISNAIPGGTCVASGSNVTCTNVPTGSFEGLQFIYGQIGNQTPQSTGERVRITALQQLDSDGDGLPDGWELQFALDDRNANGDNGSSGDPDDDGFSNIQEFNLGTNPTLADTDSDGINDKNESEILLTDPLDPDSDSSLTPNVNEAGNGVTDGNEDFDGDGFTNRQEVFNETDAFNSAENPDTGPTGTPTPTIDNGGSGGGNQGGSGGSGGGNGGDSGSGNGGTVDDIIDNLTDTEKTGGFQLLGLFGVGLVIAGGVGLLFTEFKKRRINK